MIVGAREEEEQQEERGRATGSGILAKRFKKMFQFWIKGEQSSESPTSRVCWLIDSMQSSCRSAVLLSKAKHPPKIIKSPRLVGNDIYASMVKKAGQSLIFQLEIGRVSKVLTLSKIQGPK